VHRAYLKPQYAAGFGGVEEVAVKVMHPGAEERFHHDFQVFRWLCKVALTGWETILDECYRQIMTEFDYRKEAQSLATVRRQMNESPYKKRIRIPEPFMDMCTKECLIMEMLHGKKLSDAIEDELATILSDKAQACALIRAKQMGE
jgi:aarF domain-containing kinase